MGQCCKKYTLCNYDIKIKNKIKLSNILFFFLILCKIHFVHLIQMLKIKLYFLIRVNKIFMYL